MRYKTIDTRSKTIDSRNIFIIKLASYILFLVS